jgi:hypothetical protein
MVQTWSAEVVVDADLARRLIGQFADLRVESLRLLSEGWAGGCPPSGEGHHRHHITTCALECRMVDGFIGQGGGTASSHHLEGGGRERRAGDPLDSRGARPPPGLKDARGCRRSATRGRASSAASVICGERGHPHPGSCLGVCPMLPSPNRPELEPCGSVFLMFKRSARP